MVEFEQGEFMKTLVREDSKITSKSSLSDIFRSGFKKEKTLGVEYEKLPVNSATNKATPFFFKDGILDFLYNLKNETGGIPSFENDIMLGLVLNSGRITLEPGCQLEMSLRPLENISDIERELKSYNSVTAKIAKKLGITFLALGAQPVSTFKNIKIIPKSRYAFMTKFLKNTGTLPYVMMRETAGIQTSIDYESEEDAIRKLSLALKLSPILSCFYVNSPVRNGKLTGYKSNRLNSWLNTDNKRCGLVSKKLFDNPKDFSFGDYTEILLDVPAIFNKNNYAGAKTFDELIKDGIADISDWQTHISLFFPDVRLKNYVEIRNHDCQKPDIALSVPALYKGIFYSSGGMNETEELLKDFSYYDFEFIRQNAPRFGMDFSVKNTKISDLLKEIFNIASEGLKEFSLNEEIYLEPVMSLLYDNMTPADIIIKNFDGSWNRDIKKLVKFSEIN